MDTYADYKSLRPPRSSKWKQKSTKSRKGCSCCRNPRLTSRLATKAFIAKDLDNQFLSSYGTRGGHGAAEFVDWFYAVEDVEEISQEKESAESPHMELGLTEDQYHAMLKEHIRSGEGIGGQVCG